MTPSRTHALIRCLVYALALCLFATAVSAQHIRIIPARRQIQPAAFVPGSLTSGAHQLTGGGPTRQTWPTGTWTPGGGIRITYFGGSTVWFAETDAVDQHAQHRVVPNLNPGVLCDEPMHVTTDDGWTLIVYSARYGSAWPAYSTPSGLMSVAARIVRPDGSFAGDEFTLVPDSAQLGGVQTDWLPRACVTPTGFYVAWTHGSGTGENAWGRAVGRDGTLGPAALLSPGMPSSQNYPDVAALPTGELLTTFRDTGTGEPGGLADIRSTTGLIAGAVGEQRETRLTPYGARGYIQVHQEGTGPGSSARAVLVRRSGQRAGFSFPITDGQPGVSWIDPRAKQLDHRWIAVVHGRSGGMALPCYRMFEGRTPVSDLEPMFPGLDLFYDTGANPQANRITPSVDVRGTDILFVAAGASFPGGPLRVWMRTL